MNLKLHEPVYMLFCDIGIFRQTLNLIFVKTFDLKLMKFWYSYISKTLLNLKFTPIFKNNI